MQDVAEPTRRLFIGVLASPVVRAAIVEHCKGWRWPRGSRMTPAERLHLTLHFLGDVEVSRANALQAALAETPMYPLGLELCRAQLWRNGVAVLLPAQHAGLRELHDRLEQPLRHVGLVVPPDRWTAHVTLARRAAGAGLPEPAPRIAWTLSEFALVESQRSPTVRYEALARYPARPMPPR